MRRASNDLFDVQLVIFSQIRSMTSRVGTARITRLQNTKSAQM